MVVTDTQATPPAVPATPEVGPGGNEFRDPLQTVTKPQKVGMWEKEQTRLEEALTQGTTIIGVRGPREVLAGRKMPPKQVLEDDSSVAE